MKDLPATEVPGVHKAHAQLMQTFIHLYVTYRAAVAIGAHVTVPLSTAVAPAASAWSQSCHLSLMYSQKWVAGWGGVGPARSLGWVQPPTCCHPP